MKVQVELYATLNKFLPPGAEGRKATLELPDGSTIADLLKRLQIPPEMTALLMVNGTHQPPETALKDGETLAIFPPLAGGTPLGWPPLAGGLPVALSSDDFRLTIFD